MKKLSLVLLLFSFTVLFAWSQTAEKKSDKDDKGAAAKNAPTKPAKTAKKKNACGHGAQSGPPTYVPIHISAGGTVSPDPATVHTDADERPEFFNDTDTACGVSFNPSAAASKDIQPHASKRMPQVVAPCGQYTYFVACGAKAKGGKKSSDGKGETGKDQTKIVDPVIIVTP